jgi:HEAT repeat protein
MTRQRRTSTDKKNKGIVRGPSGADLSGDLARLSDYGVRSRADMMALVRRPQAPRIARATGCRVLARLGGSGAREVLIQQLRSAQDSVVYWEAAKGIALLGDRKAVEPLGKLVNGRLEGRRRAAAAYALGMMGERAATRPLLKAINTPTTPPLVRAYAVEALGVLEATEAREAITALLEKDRSPRVRAAAAYALGRVGTRDTLSVLKRTVERDSAVVPYVGKISGIARASIRHIRRATKTRRQ